LKYALTHEETVQQTNIISQQAAAKSY
jgi:hypothetical protein